MLQVSELRTVAADELWLSPAYRQDSLAVHFTWVRDVARVLPAVRAVEAALLPLDARPHWGKVYAADPAAVAARYERLPDFVALAQSLDPTGRFRYEALVRIAVVVRPSATSSGSGRRCGPSCRSPSPPGGTAP